jgi:hypothetical protein
MRRGLVRPVVVATRSAAATEQPEHQEREPSLCSRMAFACGCNGLAQEILQATAHLTGGKPRIRANSIRSEILVIEFARILGLSLFMMRRAATLFSLLMARLLAVRDFDAIQVSPY